MIGKILALAMGAATTPVMARPHEDIPAMVLVPAGTFDMTVPLDRADGPPGNAPATMPTTIKHVAIGSSFRIARTEITVGQFAAFVAATKRPDPDRCFLFQTIGADGKAAFGWRQHASWRAPSYPQTNRFPATCIRWIDAHEYAEWLSRRTGRHFRLPTEAEWEFAARGGAPAEKIATGSCTEGNGADLVLKRAYPGLRAYAACDDGALYAAPSPVIGPIGSACTIWSATSGNGPRIAIIEAMRISRPMDRLGMIR